MVTGPFVCHAIKKSKIAAKLRDVEAKVNISEIQRRDDILNADWGKHFLRV